MPSSSHAAGRSRIVPLLVLPAAAVVGVFIVWPVVQAVTWSVQSSPVDGHWVGLRWYRQLLADPGFARAVLHTFFLAAGSLVVQMPLALLLASMLTCRLRGRSLLRLSFFVPVLLPTSAVAVVWMLLYNPPHEVVNRLLMAAGLGKVSWLGGSEYLAMVSLLVVVSWKYVGFHMMLFVAGIESIPEEIYEAARLDGAGSWATFRHVTLPLLKRVLVISMTLSLIGSLKYFDIVWVMTGGDGPFSGATDLMATYMYRNAFGVSTNPAYACAAAVAILIVCVGAFVAMRLLAGGALRGTTTVLRRLVARATAGRGGAP